MVSVNDSAIGNAVTSPGSVSGDKPFTLNDVAPDAPKNAVKSTDEPEPSPVYVFVRTPFVAVTLMPPAKPVGSESIEANPLASVIAKS